jgi:hypothetical protein
MTEHPRQVAFENGSVVVDAATVASALRLDVKRLQDLIRAGQIVTVCETGVDEDAGTWRLTFRLPNRRLRLVVDASGRVLRRSVINFGDRTMPDPSRERT